MQDSGGLAVTTGMDTPVQPTSTEVPPTDSATHHLQEPVSHGVSLEDATVSQVSPTVYHPSLIFIKVRHGSFWIFAQGPPGP